MAANTYGLQTLTWGVPTSTGFVVTSQTNAKTAGIQAEVFDENGRRVAARYDDVIQNVTFEALVTTGDSPEPGEEFTCDSIAYEVVSVEVKRVNNDFQRLTIVGKRSEYL
jgi:hypothetical protein